MKTELTQYPGNSNSPHYTDIPVVVQGATCNQNGLGWIETPQVTQTIDVATGPSTVNIVPWTVDATSKTATPDMRACNGVFDETYTLAAVQKGESSLPSFITHDGNGVLTVTPLDYTHMGDWTIEVTQTTTYGNDPVWDAVVITVGCTIATITPDAAPATQVYNLYDSSLIVDLSTWAYTQDPSCDYSFSSSYEWEIPSDGTEYITDSVPSNYQAVTIQSQKKAAVGTYSLRLKNTITDNNEVPA